MKNILHGDFGTSFRYNQNALQIVLERAPYSFLLAGISSVLALIIAIPLGLLSARTRNSFFDFIVTGLSVLGQAMPSFWMAIMFILLFSVKLRILPVSGLGFLIHIAMIVFSIMGIINVSEGKMKELPIVGDLAKKLNF
jgi:peptide/nickel transport system permease protein